MKLLYFPLQLWWNIVCTCEAIRLGIRWARIEISLIQAGEIDISRPLAEFCARSYYEFASKHPKSMRRSGTYVEMMIPFYHRVLSIRLRDDYSKKRAELTALLDSEVLKVCEKNVLAQF